MLEQHQKYFDENRGRIIAGHENEFALVSMPNVEYFVNIGDAVAKGASEHGYGNFAVCPCVSYEDSIMHFVNL